MPGKEVKTMIEVKVKKLRETLALLAPVIPKKSALPVLEHFLLQDGKAIATDLEEYVSLELPEAREPILLPRKVEDFLKLIPGDTVAKITQDNAGVTVLCGVTSSTFLTDKLSAEDYPTTPEEPGISIRMDGDKLVEALSMALTYAAREDSRPVLTGVALVMEEQGACACGADGYRLLCKEVPGTFSTPRTVVIPARTVKVLEGLWKKIDHAVNPAVDALLAELALSKRLIALGFSGYRMVAKFGPVAITSQLIQGTFPNFRQLIPKDLTKKVKVYAPDFCMAVRQVKDVASDGSGIVRMEWTENTMKVNAQSGEKGTVETEFRVSVTGGPGRIAINCKYLLEYLKERQGMVEMGTTTPSSPVLFLDGRCQVVLMPMFAKWGDEPKTEAPAPPEDAEPEPQDIPEEVGDGEPPVCEVKRRKKRKR